VTRGPKQELVRLPSSARVAFATAALLLLAGSGTWAADPAADVDGIRRQTAQVRGLEPIVEMPVEVVDQPTLGRLVTSRLYTESSIQQYLARQKLLTLLGLLPPGFDLRGFELSLLSEPTAALYHRGLKTLYVAVPAGSLSGDDKIVVAHELTHALQDQYFGLTFLLPDDPDNSDRQAAVRALVEGDATMAEVFWGRRFLSPAEKIQIGSGGQTDASARLRAAPLVVREELLFPYQPGLAFVMGLHHLGGYEAVNRALRQPPQSTEQVIHPDKYLAGDAPRWVQLPPLAEILGGSWRTLRTDVLGELDLRVLIQQFGNQIEAGTAAAGWGGDRYAILEDEDGRLVVALVTVWDTEPDAAEFFNAYLGTVVRRYVSTPIGAQYQPSLARWAVPEGMIQLLRTEDQVRLVFAPDVDTLDAVANALAGIREPAGTRSSSFPGQGAGPGRHPPVSSYHR